jgi:hypothetical protein
MAGIQDAIGNYRKNLAGGLASPQLSPELLKALKIPKGADKSVFERLIGGYDKASKQNAENLQGLGFQRFDGALGSNEAETPQGAILSTLGEGILNIPSAFAQVYSPVKSLLEAPFIAGGDYLSDKSVKEKGRQSLGQDILRQLSAQDRMQQGQLPRKESSTMGQGSGEYLDTRGQDETGIEAAIGDENTGEYLNQEEMKQKIKENTQLGDMSQEGADMEVITSEMREPVLSAEEKKAQAQQSLFKSAMDDITNIYGDGTKKDTSRKTLDEYKADFAKATGIDVSGEPDNKLALMSLGLSLMQNKAGKDFNLSNIIGSAGEAGQAAMPLFQKAKDDARAGQVAAGKYALQETKADSLAKLATAKEKRAALTGLSKEFREYGQKYALAQMKHVNALNIKELEMRAKGIEPKGTITRQTLNGFPTLKISKGFVASNKNNSVYLQAPEDAKLHANAYVGLLEAENSIDKMKTIFTEMDKNPGPQAYNTVKDRFFRLLKPLGIGNENYTKDINFTEKEYNSLSGESRIKMIQDRLISQYKKFLTKESGNGVSEGDIKRLQILVGKISLTAPFKENMARLDELAKIFKQPRTTLEGTFAEFGKRKNHMSDDSYKDTMNIINKAISTGTEDLYSSGFNDDGVFTIDLRKK